MSTPERYDNLRPGDKVTIEYEAVKIHSDSITFKSGNVNGLLFYLNTLKARGAVVTRAPREVQPGDTFIFENDTPPEQSYKRVLIWKDDKTVVFDHYEHRGRVTRLTSNNGNRGVLIYHDFDA